MGGFESTRRGTLGVWLCAASLFLLFVSLALVLLLIVGKGVGGLWPRDVVRFTTPDGDLLGEIHKREELPGEASRSRWLLKVGNRERTGTDFLWVEEQPGVSFAPEPAALVLEREEYGVFIGIPLELRTGAARAAADDPAFPAAFDEAWRQARDLAARNQSLNEVLSGMHAPLTRLQEEAQAAELRGETDKAARLRAELEQRDREVSDRSQPLLEEQVRNAEAQAALLLVLRTGDGGEAEIPLGDVVRSYAPSALSAGGKLAIWGQHAWEFLSADPRESNMEGGVFPALFGTALLVLIMTLFCVPLGVVAAVYMHEYAKPGLFLNLVRLAIQNLAGVPSIVYGLFGLGFFVYGVGGAIDRMFFANRLPTPTFGSGGLLWAALTLALLTVPVVIIATLEGLASVPKSYREASLALSASRWQTIRRVVLPTAMPGILTGVILAISRGAGEVAPLMITGVVKLAPDLPLDGTAPFLHPERHFMHLGFHIYDVAFQSPNVEAAKPMVYASILLLLLLVAALNLTAVRLRNRLRARLKGAVL